MKINGIDSRDFVAKDKGLRFKDIAIGEVYQTSNGAVCLKFGWDRAVCLCGCNGCWYITEAIGYKENIIKNLGMLTGIEVANGS